ncbi:MAG: DUF11 domain-containing protein, partial [Methanobacterium paludis]|nr:DUF11 domain-containing protein [Methanobacterium paludis]
MQKRLILLVIAIVFTMTAGTVSAADISDNGTYSQDKLTVNMEQTNNSTINTSQSFPDPKLYNHNGNLISSYSTIQDAYNNAATGSSTELDTIELESGATFNLQDFEIKKNLNFTVSNGGTATIDGGLNNRLIHIYPGYTVYFNNIIFQNGHAPDGTLLFPDGSNGGAIWNEGTAYLINCVVRNNQAGDGGSITYGGIGGKGGAIYNTGALNITDSKIYDNQAGNGSEGFIATHSNGFDGGPGGAIYSTGTLTITDSELYNNRAGHGGDGVILGEGGSGGSGGAIYNTGNMALNNTKVHNNFAGNAGTGGTKLIIGGTGGTGGNGGGLYNTGTSIITDSEINSNTAGDGGSGSDADDGSLIHLDGYTGHQGGAGGDGGAVYNTGHLEISKTNVADNNAGDGGVGGNGGNALQGFDPHNGGDGGQGGSGGNAGGIFNSNYLKIVESTVTGSRSGKGGSGGSGGKGSDSWSYWVPFHTVTVPSGNGGNGGSGGSAGSGAGIYHSGSYLEVTGNNLTNNQIGTPGIGGAGGSKGSGNGGHDGVTGNTGTTGTGGAVYSTVNVSTIHFNRILNNTTPDVAGATGVNINAENNWWGTNFNGTNPVTAGRVSAQVDADPWVVLSLVLPTHIYNGIPVQVTGDLTRNSDGNPVGGNIPDDVQADFTATHGIINTPVYTLNGQANTTYSPTSSGLATFSVTVDDQTVTTDQNVESRSVLDFTKSVSNNHPNYGDIIHFIITVQNSGPDTANGVTVYDKLPVGLVYQSHTLNYGSYNSSTGLWNIGDLTVARGGVYLDISALVNGTGFFNNTATLSQTTYSQTDVNRSATLNVD